DLARPTPTRHSRQLLTVTARLRGMAHCPNVRAGAEVAGFVVPLWFSTYVDDWDALSETARVVWGKTNHDRGLVSLPLFRHLADSADVAGLLWDVWLPVTV